MIPTFLPALSIAFSAGMKAFGLSGQGDASLLVAQRRSQALNFEADQLDTNAGQAIAASQRNAYFKGKEGDLALSRLKALAAASGGGATDPTVLNLQADLMHQKAYNLATALYAGEDQSRLLKTEAKVKRYQGDLGVADAENTKSSYNFAALSSLASGGASLYEKYAL